MYNHNQKKKIMLLFLLRVVALIQVQPLLGFGALIQSAFVLLEHIRWFAFQSPLVFLFLLPTIFLLPTAFDLFLFLKSSFKFFSNSSASCLPKFSIHSIHNLSSLSLFSYSESVISIEHKNLHHPHYQKA